KFISGAFVVNKSTRVFSSIALDHAQKQENASIKEDGGAVGLTENPQALRRWMIGGPELARMVNEYEVQSLLKKKETKHHDQMTSVQKTFVKEVKALIDAVEELGNPFREDSGELLVLDTKDIMPKEVVDSVKNIEKLGHDQYTAFVKEREYVATVFIPYVISQLRSAQRIDIAWDTYKDDSLKSGTRDRRGSGARRRVALSVKIPPNWKSFLRVDENKTELFRLLAEEVIDIDAQGKERSLALPVFHALTACDTVSFFGGKSKKSAWDTWNAFPEVTRSFLEIATAPDELSNNCTQTIERFVVLLYDRGSQLSSVDDARQQLFCKRSRSLDRIPPTSAALRQHFLRAAYQGGHVWSQVHVALPELPSPSEWGWEKDEFWRPVWTTLPQAQQSCYETDPLFLQEGLPRVVQVFQIQFAVYSFVRLRWKLLQLRGIFSDASISKIVKYL
ncbi:hypothetical protein QZH41_014645, partial [Actinostola sp. cb2023]